MLSHFTDIAGKLIGSRHVKKPLVLDIEGQFPDNIHIDTIAHDGIRRDLRPKDWMPAKFTTWMTDGDEIARRAFKRGYDALVLTNTADGEDVVVMVFGGTHFVRRHGGEAARGKALR